MQLPLNEKLRPGSWKPARNRWSSTNVYAILRCPKCSTTGVILKHQHRVEENGVVTPEVTCQQPECKWKASVRLAGWKPEYASIKRNERVAA